MHILDRFTHAPRVTQKLLDPPSMAALLHFSCYVSSKILPSGLGLVGATLVALALLYPRTMPDARAQRKLLPGVPGFLGTHPLTSKLHHLFTMGTAGQTPEQKTWYLLSPTLTKI